MISETTILCSALAAQTPGLSGPERRFNGEVISIFWDRRPTVIDVILCCIDNRTRI